MSTQGAWARGVSSSPAVRGSAPVPLGDGVGACGGRRVSVPPGRGASTPVDWSEPVLLGDRFFLVAHDDRTGRSRLHPRATGLGLAACQLGELVLAERVVVAGGLVEVITPMPLADGLGSAVLRMLFAYPQHRSLDTWLSFLAQTSAGYVGGRLAAVGLVSRDSRWGLSGRRAVFRALTPQQRDAGEWERVRLARLLCTATPVGVTDATLAGLMRATGLTRHVLWDPHTHRPGVERLPAVVGGLPDALRELVIAIEVAVGAAVAAHR